MTGHTPPAPFAPGARDPRVDLLPPPTIGGEWGEAWDLSPQMRERDAQVPDVESAAVSSWLVHAPQSHPMWKCLWIAAAHLRPARGVDDSDLRIYLPGATHELWVHALDPRPDLLEEFQQHRFSIMSPINFAAQLILPDDAACDALVRHACSEICHGQLNPDTDGRQQWIARFGDNMIRGGFGG